MSLSSVHICGKTELGVKPTNKNRRLHVGTAFVKKRVLRKMLRRSHADLRTECYG